MDTLREAPKPVDLSTSSARPKRGWLRPALAFGALLIVLAIGWLTLRPASVVVAQVRTGPAVESVYASGVVEYVREATIAPVVNAPIRRVLVEEGQIVRAGQLLVDLVDGPEQATALQLEAQASQARERFDRQERLFQRGFAAEAARDDARRVYQAAAAAARAARETLRDYHLAAPFAGTVLRREAEPGDLARMGAPLIVMADTSAIRVTADIDERDSGRLSVGLDALVRADAFPDRQFPARLVELTPQGDAAARVFRARLLLANDTPLRPGMTVEANIIVAQRQNAVLAPSDSVVNGAVFVVEGGRARRRAVEVGVSGGESVEIVRGLRPGETVVAEPPPDLKDGARVAARQQAR